MEFSSGGCRKYKNLRKCHGGFLVIAPIKTINPCFSQVIGTQGIRFEVLSQIFTDIDMFSAKYHSFHRSFPRQHQGFS